MLRKLPSRAATACTSLMLKWWVLWKLQANSHMHVKGKLQCKCRQGKWCWCVIRPNHKAALTELGSRNQFFKIRTEEIIDKLVLTELVPPEGCCLLCLRSLLSCPPKDPPSNGLFWCLPTASRQLLLCCRPENRPVLPNSLPYASPLLLLLQMSLPRD